MARKGWHVPSAHVASSRPYTDAVTLILGMSQPEGIYLCVDYRVTDSRSGRLVDDAVTKHLTIHYPPAEGGPRTLVAYTGVAMLPDGTTTGDWIRETLRGEAEVFDVSMQHLLDRLDRDYAQLRQPLIINCLVIHGASRYFGGMSNLKVTNGRVRVQPTFNYQMNEIEAPVVFANGSGVMAIAAREQLGRLERQLGIVPKRPMNYMKLLSLVNRDISSRCPSVSPYCHVAFENALGYPFGPEARTFTNPGESVPFESPLLLYGLDLTGMMKLSREHAEYFFAGRVSHLDEAALDQVDDGLKRRP